MQSAIKVKLISIKRLFKEIRKNYDKSKCTAREIEIMIFLYLNSVKTLKDISHGTNLIESVISKYIKNLVSASFINNSKKPTEKLINILKDFNKLNEIYLFIKKFREIYDEKTCTAIEIELLVFILYKDDTTITEIYTELNLSQSSVSKFVKKMEILKLLERKRNKIIPTKKLLSYIEFSLNLKEEIE